MTVLSKFRGYVGQLTKIFEIMDNCGPGNLDLKAYFRENGYPIVVGPIFHSTVEMLRRLLGIPKDEKFIIFRVDAKDDVEEIGNATVFKTDTDVCLPGSSTVVLFETWETDVHYNIALNSLRLEKDTKIYIGEYDPSWTTSINELIKGFEGRVFKIFPEDGEPLRG